MKIIFIIKLLISVSTNNEFEKTEQSEDLKQSTETNSPSDQPQSSSAIKNVKNNLDSQQVTMHKTTSDDDDEEEEEENDNFDYDDEDEYMDCYDDNLWKDAMHDQSQSSSALDEWKNLELRQAASRGDKVKCEQMLASGADINSRNIDGESPVTVAAKNGHHQVVKILAQAEADLDQLIIDRYGANLMSQGSDLSPLTHPSQDQPQSSSAIQNVVPSLDP